MHSARTFAFGPFLLVPERQLLLRNGERVRIGGRALDLLTALVERAGELISKRDLTARAWPTTFVEEANLKVNMGLLRRVLDDTAEPGGYIATVIGRGYRFVAPVKLTVTPAGQAETTPLPTGAVEQTRPSFTGAERGQDWQNVCEVRFLSIRSRTAGGLTTLSVQLAESAICQPNNGAAQGLLEALNALLGNAALDGILGRPAHARPSGQSVIAANERAKAGLSKQEADPARPRHG